MAMRSLEESSTFWSTSLRPGVGPAARRSGATSGLVAPRPCFLAELLRRDQVGSGRLWPGSGLVAGLDGEAVVPGLQGDRQLPGRGWLGWRGRGREDGSGCRDP